jgi:hypothetical protein
VKRQWLSVPKGKTVNESVLFTQARHRRAASEGAGQWKGKDAFSRHELWLPMERRSRPPDHLRGRGPLGMHHWRNRRPGYPLSGCSPAEPDSVSPGRINVAKMVLADKPDENKRITTWIMSGVPNRGRKRKSLYRSQDVSAGPTALEFDAPDGNICP